MYCTQQVIQGENFRDQLKTMKSAKVFVLPCMVCKNISTNICVKKFYQNNFYLFLHAKIFWLQKIKHITEASPLLTVHESVRELPQLSK